MEQSVFSWWFAKRLATLVGATVLFGCVLGLVLVHAAVSGNNDARGWAAPRTMAIRRVGSAAAQQTTPTLFSNLDCTTITYRLVGGSDMRTGCFTETAFGMFDSDSYVAIFNGTDEGLPLSPYTAHQVLAPWPKAMNLIALSPLNTGGSLIGLYKNPLANLQNQRNTLGRLTGKQLVAPPNLTIKDPSGSSLAVNPQTLAFSDGGSWLVAETLGGSFVRINLATLDLMAFAPSYGSQGSPALLKSRVAVSEDGRFIAIANDVAAEFKVYDLEACDGVVHNLQPQSCGSYDYWQFAARQVSGLRSIRRVRFLNDGLLSFEAVSADPAHSGTYELAPTSSITSLTDYIGLGDSYTSGEGAFDYLDGTDTPDNTCHLSRGSYPLLLAHDLFGGPGGHSVACSGAIINDIGNDGDSYSGQVRAGLSLQQLRQSEPTVLESVEANFMPGYVAQQRFVKRWQPGIATVSIGGNDIGFGDLLQNCVEPHISLRASANTCYSTYEDRLELVNLIDRTVPRWTALFDQLRREAPDTRFYAIGYPQVAYDKGDCALNVQLNKSELEFAAETIDYLNSDIRKTAAAAGLQYIDISQALNGHRLCEATSYDVAVNGLTAGGDAGPLGIGILGKESYHPNALGHELIEQAILRQTHNFNAPDSDSAENGGDDGAAASDRLLDAPKTVRTVYVRIPDDSLAPGAGKRGLGITIHAAGAGDGLQPNAAYEIRLDGPKGRLIGSGASDSSGNITGSVTIPGDTAPGGHTIDVTGENLDSKPVDITQPFYVAVSDADGDGDGIDNITDSCPYAINSGRDSDADGLDDVCDGLISLQVSRGNPAGGGTSESLKTVSGTPAAKAAGGVLGASTLNPFGVGGHVGVRVGNTRLGPHSVPLRNAGPSSWLQRLVMAAATFTLCLLARKYTKRRGFWVQ